MGKHQGSEAHSPSHGKNFPPQVYTDLRRADLHVLAPVLATEPGCSTSQDKETKELISTLPSHLRSGVPWLSTFCSTHRKLNSLPIISLWKAIVSELDVEVVEVWSQSTLTRLQSHFINRLARISWPSQTSKCEACSLSSLAGDNDLLIALGAVTLATLSPRNWDKSKRVFFLQGLLRGRANPGHASGSIQKMRELGSQLRDIRSALRKAVVDGGRSAQSSPTAHAASERHSVPPRPQRADYQADHLAVALKALAQSDEQKHDVQPVGTERTSVAASESAESSSTLRNASNPFQDTFQLDEQNLPANPGAASSVYSRSQSGESYCNSKSSSKTSVASIMREESIIDLYRHSVFPRPDGDEACTTAASTSHTKPPRNPNSELAKYPRHHLTPIWIPRSNYGGEEAMRTSALWKRRIATEPRLRVGKNGEVKGPLDSVSEISCPGDDVWF